ncbi:hypothetical protein GCM10027024_31540 [Microbacterium insulae]
MSIRSRGITSSTRARPHNTTNRVSARPLHPINVRCPSADRVAGRQEGELTGQNEWMRLSRRRGLRVRASATLFAGVLAMSGCALEATEPAIEVTSGNGVFAPLEIEVTGLPPGAEVSLRSKTNLDDMAFAARAVFIADPDGVVDLTSAQPVDGDWSAADPMAPFWAGTGGSVRQASMWDEPYDVTLTVADDNGNPLAETTVRRPGLAPGIRVQQVTDDGIIGVYATPAEMDPGEPRPAVLAFGGSEGGGEFAAATARWIAGLGYPALGISYFGSDGQPTRLEEVPAETFLTALDWLHQQPGVDGERVFTYGASRGGEMALWLAATHPGKVFGAFAPVGAGAIVCGVPDTTLPAWTLSGHPLVEDCFGPEDTRIPASAGIDVRAITGPVVLACGTEDQLWLSCEFADDILNRRELEQQTLLARGEGADHYVTMAPYIPWPDLTDDPSTLAESHTVRVELWQSINETLAAASQ